MDKLTKEQISNMIQTALKLESQLKSIKEVLSECKECEECHELAQTDYVRWYHNTEDETYLNTCEECQKNFKKYIG